MENKGTTKKIVIFLIIFVFILVAIFFLFIKKEKTLPLTNIGGEERRTAGNEKIDNSFILEGYPMEVVPLYENEKISSMKFFVNEDPQNYAGFFDKNKNYYNVVFYTKANQEELLNYYKSLMSEINEDGYSDSSVEGVIGEYKVEASHYGNDTDTAYLQVYMPTEKYSKENPYFTAYPNLVEFHPTWVRYESSYGLLNQKGGEEEYTQYFVMNNELVDEEERVEDMVEFFEMYSEKYGDKENFKANEETGLITWTDSGYSFSLTFSSDHGRIYLMERKSLQQD